MKTWSAIFRSLARTAIMCALACVFIIQTSLVVSAHQRMSHASLGVYATISGQLEASPTCANRLTNSANKSGSHLYQVDCCLFCQASHYDDNASSVIEYAKVVAILAPIAKEQDSTSWIEYHSIDPVIIGLKSSWSAQAPPQAWCFLSRVKLPHARLCSRNIPWLKNTSWSDLSKENPNRFADR